MSSGPPASSSGSGGTTASVPTSQSKDWLSSPTARRALQEALSALPDVSPLTREGRAALVARVAPHVEHRGLRLQMAGKRWPATPTDPFVGALTRTGRISTTNAVPYLVAMSGAASVPEFLDLLTPAARPRGPRTEFDVRARTRGAIASYNRGVYGDMDVTYDGTDFTTSARPTSQSGSAETNFNRALLARASQALVEHEMGELTDALREYAQACTDPTQCTKLQHLLGDVRNFISYAIETESVRTRR